MKRTFAFWSITAFLLFPFPIFSQDNQWECYPNRFYGDSYVYSDAVPNHQEWLSVMRRHMDTSIYDRWMAEEPRKIVKSIRVSHIPLVCTCGNSSRMDYGFDIRVFFSYVPIEVDPSNDNSPGCGAMFLGRERFDTVNILIKPRMPMVASRQE